jgi:hypothetical protein
MTFKGFKTYVADVLARLIKVCIQHRKPVDDAARIMRWAREQRAMIWESYEADEPVGDVARALYRMAGANRCRR